MVASGEGQKGGTITLLTIAEQFLHVDPQRIYTGVDLAFFNGYTTRTLTAYKFASGVRRHHRPRHGDRPGTPYEDANSWPFTIRDGVTFEDGSVDLRGHQVRRLADLREDIITDGPSYAISSSTSPRLEDGSSDYKGPFLTEGNDVAAFDKAITCSEDNKTITFNLNRPAADFNYTVTLTAFSPVPQAADTGENYDDAVVSTGPYKISEYTKGQKMVLVRNEEWDPASDDYRPAYPDQVIVNFALDAAAIDQRLIADAGEDQAAIATAACSPRTWRLCSRRPAFRGPLVDAFDPYVRYIAINTEKVPNLKHRQAIAVALNSAEYITIAGGDFAGTSVDGVIKPNLPPDYAESGMWVDMFGAAIPAGQRGACEEAHRGVRRADAGADLPVPADAGQ